MREGQALLPTQGIFAMPNSWSAGGHHRWKLALGSRWRGADAHFWSGWQSSCAIQISRVLAARMV